MSNVIDIETGTHRSAVGEEKKVSEESRRDQTRRLAKQILKDIGEGKSLSRGIVDGTRPSYWIIRTNDEAWPDQEWEDICALQVEDEVSQGQFELWRRRGGRTAMLRLAASPGSYITCHVFARLVEVRSGFCCVGVNFQAQPAEPYKKVTEPKPGSGKSIHKGRERLRRRFMVIEDELSRYPPKLLQHLRRLGAVELDIERLRELLDRAPMIIVMPEANIDVKFWELNAETVTRPEDVDALDGDQLGQDRDYNDDWAF